MTEAAAVPPPPTSFSDLLQQTSFMRMWSARLFGTAGTQMLMVAVGWQMYDLTGSAWDLGLVGLYQFLPALLLTLVAGHVADQYHRARIVACCLLLQMSVGAVLLLSTHEAWVSRSLLLGLSVAELVGGFARVLHEKQRIRFGWLTRCWPCSWPSTSRPSGTRPGSSSGARRSTPSC